MAFIEPINTPEYEQNVGSTETVGGSTPLGNQSQRTFDQTRNPDNKTRIEFAAALLQEIAQMPEAQAYLNSQGLRLTVNQNNLRAVVAWMEGENTRAINNPLATTRGHNDSTIYDSTRFNTANVQNYSTFENGVKATADTIVLGRYRNILKTLADPNVSAATLSEAVAPGGQTSTWGTGSFARRSGNSAEAPLGNQSSGSGGDIYAEYESDTGVRDQGNDDLDALIQEYFPDGIPDDVSWNDLAPNLQAEIKRQLGYSTTLIQHPELGSILILAALNQWSTERLQDAVRQTEWWRTTSDTAREFMQQELDDPASTQQRINNQVNTLETYARSLGITLSDESFTNIARDSLMYGWNIGQIYDALIGENDFDPNEIDVQSDLAARFAEIQQSASDYGLAFDRQSYEELAVDIVSGKKQASAINGFLIEQAKTRYPWLADQFDAGFNLRTIMAPRAQDVSNILGISTAEVDFVNDSRFNPILEYNPDGQGMRSMTTDEARRHIYSLEDYETTDDAINKSARLGRSLLQMFGEI